MFHGQRNKGGLEFRQKYLKTNTNRVQTSDIFNAYELITSFKKEKKCNSRCLNFIYSGVAKVLTRCLCIEAKLS